MASMARLWEPRLSIRTISAVVAGTCISSNYARNGITFSPRIGDFELARRRCPGCTRRFPSNAVNANSEDIKAPRAALQGISPSRYLSQRRMFARLDEIAFFPLFVTRQRVVVASPEAGKVAAHLCFATNQIRRVKHGSQTSHLSASPENP